MAGTNVPAVSCFLFRPTLARKGNSEVKNLRARFPENEGKKKKVEINLRENEKTRLHLMRAITAIRVEGRKDNQTKNRTAELLNQSAISSTASCNLSHRIFRLSFQNHCYFFLLFYEIAEKVSPSSKKIAFEI